MLTANHSTLHAIHRGLKLGISSKIQVCKSAVSVSSAVFVSVFY